MCEPLRKLGRGFVFVLFLTHSSHNRFYPNFLQKGFFRFGGKPFFLTLHHLHKKTTTGNWNNYTGGHDWGKVSKPICTREEKGGATKSPKQKPAEFIGLRGEKKSLGLLLLMVYPPKAFQSSLFFFFFPPSRPSSFNDEADQKKKISSTSFTFLFFLLLLSFGLFPSSSSSFTTIIIPLLLFLTPAERCNPERRIS